MPTFLKRLLDRQHAASTSLYPDAHRRSVARLTEASGEGEGGRPRLPAEARHLLLLK